MRYPLREVTIKISGVSVAEPKLRSCKYLTPYCPGRQKKSSGKHIRSIWDPGSFQKQCLPLPSNYHPSVFLHAVSSFLFQDALPSQGLHIWVLLVHQGLSLKSFHKVSDFLKWGRGSDYVPDMTPRIFHGFVTFHCLFLPIRGPRRAWWNLFLFFFMWVIPITRYSAQHRVGLCAMFNRWIILISCGSSIIWQRADAFKKTINTRSLVSRFYSTSEIYGISLGWLFAFKMLGTINVLDLRCFSIL